MSVGSARQRAVASLTRRPHIYTVKKQTHLDETGSDTVRHPTRRRVGCIDSTCEPTEDTHVAANADCQWERGGQRRRTRAAWRAASSRQSRGSNGAVFANDMRTLHNCAQGAAASLPPSLPHLPLPPRLWPPPAASTRHSGQHYVCRLLPRPAGLETSCRCRRCPRPLTRASALGLLLRLERSSLASVLQQAADCSALHTAKSSCLRPARACQWRVGGGRAAGRPGVSSTRHTRAGAGRGRTSTFRLWNCS